LFHENVMADNIFKESMKKFESKSKKIMQFY